MKMKLLKTILKFKSIDDKALIELKHSKELEWIQANGDLAIVYFKSKSPSVLGRVNFMLGECDCCRDYDFNITDIRAIEVYKLEDKS